MGKRTLNIYVSIFGLLALLRYALQGHEKLRMQLYPFLFFGLFVFSAFRFEVGCDWSGYFYQWTQQKNSTFALALLDPEPVWWALIHAVQSLGLSYLWLNIASSAIFFLGVYVLAQRQPDPFGFLVLLFPILIVNMPMSGIRQAAAIGLICIAFAAFIDKKIFWFTAWTLLASTIHNSAIVFFLLIPLVGGKYTRKRLLLAVILAIPGALVLLNGEAADQTTTRYINAGNEAAGAVFRIGLLLITSFSYFLFIQRKWKSKFPEDYKLVSVGALMMCGIIAILPVSSVISDRFGYYLIPIQIIIFARIPYFRIQNSKAFYSAVPYLGLGLVLIIWTALSSHFAQCYVPYQTWFFGIPPSTTYTY